jgi:hypothetical protein
MRGNAITAGASLQDAVTLARYLEDAARVEPDALAAGAEHSRTLYRGEGCSPSYVSGPRHRAYVGLPDSRRSGIAYDDGFSVLPLTIAR